MTCLQIQNITRGYIFRLWVIVGWELKKCRRRWFNCRVCFLDDDDDDDDELFSKRKTNLVPQDDHFRFDNPPCSTDVVDITIMARQTYQNVSLILTLSVQQTKTDTSENIVNPDETARKEQSHQNLHSLLVFKTETHISISGQVQIQGWKNPLQKLRDERVKAP